MKKVFLIFIALTISILMEAQEKSKQKEVGLAFSSFDNFGLTYKTGSEKSLWRFTTLLISGNNSEESSDSLVTTQSNTGFGIKFGKEYRKVIAENLEFRYGLDLAFSYSHSTYTLDDKTVSDHDITSERTIYQPGVNLVIGINYVFNNHFVIGAELLPHLSYQTAITKGSRYNNDGETGRAISGFLYGLSSTSALLSLAYRF